MIRKPRLFTPGPTPLLPAAQRAMAAADLHHRTAEFRRAHAAALEGLKYFYGTANDVILFTSSGTGAMEAAVSNLFSPGERVLVGTAGKFGERWVELARAFGLQSEVVSAPYGRTVPVAEMAEKLRSIPDLRGVFLQATESSTGVRHDVEGIARAIRAARPGDDAPVLVIDAITGLGTTPLDVDRWGLDAVIGGSQKALMVPPGLSFISMSDRAWRRAESAKCPRYYFDLRRERKAVRKGEAAFTPATALVLALAEALSYLREMGREQLIANAHLLAEATRAGVRAMGLELFAVESPSDALTAVLPPAGIDADAVIKEMRTRFGITPADGQGEMKGKMFRIAHIGYYDFVETVGMLAALELSLESLGAPVKSGQAARAAQQVWRASHAAAEPAGARH